MSCGIPTVGVQAELAASMGQEMKRREFITLLGGAAAAWPLHGTGAAPGPPTLTVSMDPANWWFQYSPGMPLHPTADGAGGLYFNFPHQDGVHHLVYLAAGSISGAGSMRATLRVEAAEGAVFKESDPCGDHNAAVRLYFQRAGDNWATDFYRWWSNPISYRLAKGSIILDVPLLPGQWSSVFGAKGDSNSTATDAFNAAKRSVQAVGLTFGGCFFAHGVYVTGGSARFSAISFTVQ